MIKPFTPKDFRELEEGHFRVKWDNGQKEGQLWGKPLTCSPSFYICGRFSVEKMRTGTWRVQMVSGVEYEYKKKTPTIIGHEDARHFIQELEWATPGKKQLRDTLMQCCNFPISVEEFKRKPFFKEHELDTHCDFFRMDYEIPLRVAMGGQSQAIRKLTGDQLSEVFFILEKMPWKLWFYEYCKPFGLKEMTYKNFNTYRFRYPCKLNHPMMLTALRFYGYLKDCREKHGNEVFDKNTLFKSYLNDQEWGRRAFENSDAKRLNDALDFLMCHALDEPFPGKLCMKRDIFHNRVIATALDMIHGTPKLREGNETPCMPSDKLSDIQKSVIQHVHCNKVTFLQGAPGTGKTEVLVGIMTHFRAPLVVTFVGMMVDALQGRFGKRTETASTIHYVCCTAESLELDLKTKWLSQYDLLVIDEGSNVDSKLFYRLMNQTARYMSRLVIVGDLNQIYPIKPGAPFYDLVNRFPSHTFRLSENMRVDPDARDLARASENIVRGDKRVEFNDTSLRLYPEPTKETLEKVLNEYVKCESDLMMMQIVTLRNKERRMLNTWTEEILLARGLLIKRPGQVVWINKNPYFTGKKVMFTKNVKEDGVRNGELGQVFKVTQDGHGKITLVLTNGKEICNPKYIEPGYATTCNKSQGSEWKNILFWTYQDPSPFFTLEYAYVAISRAKKQCIVVGAREWFDAVCSRRAKSRETLLKYYLESVSIESHPYDHVKLKIPSELTLLPIDVPAVPLFPLSDETTKKGKKIKRDKF